MGHRPIVWFSRALVALVMLVAAAAAYVFGYSEWALRRTRPVPLTPFASEPAVADSVEGRRLAVLVGCLAGCHGMEGQGGKEGADGIFFATAPPLSQVLPRYSDAELARLVRFGVKRDGRTAVGMPAGTFYPLADADMARIFAHLRRRPVWAEQPRTRRVEPLGRLAMALGRWQVSADEVDPSKPRWGELPRTTPFERGRYLVHVICVECHGQDLKGRSYLGSADLGIVAGYDSAQFVRLMRTGVPPSGRDLGLMGRVARAAFREFTDGEIADVRTYLAEREK